MKMDDVYEILNFIFDSNLMTHQLPVAVDYLTENKPTWFTDAENIINSIKKK